MLNKAEQTTQNIMTKYDNDVQKLTKQVCIYFIKEEILIYFDYIAFQYSTRI
jgi:hypothetical protein